jgi:hypothetical protein
MRFEACEADLRGCTPIGDANSDRIGPVKRPSSLEPRNACALPKVLEWEGLNN